MGPLSRSTLPSDSPGEAGAAPRFVKLMKNYDALALLLEFLADDPVFGKFELRTILKAIRYQIGQGFHIAALRDEKIVGYCGWIAIEPTNGLAWEAGVGELKPLSGPNAGGAMGRALTIVSSKESAVMRRLIRGAREENKGKRVFFKRQFGQGAAKSDRKANVLNR